MTQLTLGIALFIGALMLIAALLWMAGRDWDLRKCLMFVGVVALITAMVMAVLAAGVKL